MSIVTIESVAFPGVFLRLDGGSVNRKSHNGVGGTANCQYGAGAWEHFRMVRLPGEMVSFGCTAFANVFLRLDGKNIEKNHAYPNGAGVINARYGIQPWEKFFLHLNEDDNSISIESAYPPWAGIYVRLDGSCVTEFMPSGGGMVNCQNSSGPYERFKIVSPAFQPLTLPEINTAISTYGPRLFLTADEKYLPCSVDALLQHASLVNADKTEIKHPTEAQLPDGKIGKDPSWLVIEDDFLGGDFSTAKPYVRVHWEEGASYTDIQFWFLYAYNGHATIDIRYYNFSQPNEPDCLTSLNVAPFGEHYGDWECCMLRFDNISKSPIGAWLSQHSGGTMYTQQQVSSWMSQDKNPSVLASRNGHAIFPPPPDANYLDFFDGTSVGDDGTEVGIKISVNNQTGEARELDCARKFEIISVNYLDDVREPNWIQYPYRWGPVSAPPDWTIQDVLQMIHDASPSLTIIFGPFVVVPSAIAIVNFLEKQGRGGPVGPKFHEAWDGTYGENPLGE